MRRIEMRRRRIQSVGVAVFAVCAFIGAAVPARSFAADAEPQPSAPSEAPAAKADCPTGPFAEVPDAQAWDTFGGAIPLHQVNLRLFSYGGSMQAAYAYRLASFLSVGAAFSFSLPFTVTRSELLVPDNGPALSIPFRISLLNSAASSMALHIAPGLGWTDQQVASDRRWVFQLALALNYMHWVRKGVLQVGAGLNYELFHGIGTGRAVGPLLVGPMAQFWVHPSFGFWAEVKAGPHFSPTSPQLAFRGAVGVAFGLPQ